MRATSEYDESHMRLANYPRYIHCTYFIHEFIQKMKKKNHF